MHIYAIKFREKGQKNYFSVLFQAANFEGYKEQMKTWLETTDYDVDKRTISWAGGSIPFYTNFDKEPMVIYANLDDIA